MGSSIQAIPFDEESNRQIVEHVLFELVCRVLGQYFEESGFFGEPRVLVPVIKDLLGLSVASALIVG